MVLFSHQDGELMKCVETQEWQELADGFGALYNEKSPISFTIVAASILEDQVLRTVQKVAPGSEGYIRSQHSRICLLCDMGLITSDIANALKYFANIRNSFAHKPHMTSFEDQNTRKDVENLKKALASESGDDALSGYWATLTGIDERFTTLGVQTPWTHPVARIILAAYIILGFYLIWARRWAPSPKTPKRLKDIGKHRTSDGTSVMDA